MMNSYGNEISQQLSVNVGQVEYLLEDQVTYSFSRVKDFDESRWQTATSYPLNLGNLEQGAWGRFRLYNVESVDIERILEFANPRLHRLSIYIESPSGEVSEWQLGSSLPYIEREIMFRNFAISLKLPAKQEQLIYFRAESNVGVFLPINIHKESEFWHLASNENLVYGLYFGILIMFIVFNVSLYLARNNYLFILLAIDLSIFSLMYANHLGLNFEYLWPVDPQFNYLASLFFGNMVIFTANVFTWHFLKLDEKKLLQRIYYSFNAAAITGIILLWVIPISISSFFSAILGMLIAIYLAFLTTRNLHRYGDYPTYYIFSYCAAAMATFIYIAHKLALVPTNFLTTNSIGVSILLQAVVLTCVLIERKKVTEKMIGFRSQIQAVPDSARDWIAQFSHEIRTPLNGIIGMADLLKETPLNPTQYGYVRTLSASGEYLIELVGDVLDYENLLNGSVELNETVFDLRALCEDCCGMLERQASDSQVTIDLEFVDNMPEYFKGDVKRLKQIIINLLSNSIKFTHQGKVLIKARYTDVNILVLTVWDNGIGITKQQQLGIFERFRQADQTIYPRYGGTGLGLAICRQLAHLLGGKISVASRVDEYCCFTLEIPLGIGEKPVAEVGIKTYSENDSEMPPARHLNAELTILGVDDNEINRRVLKAMLKKLGHRMIEAASGQEAIDIVRSGAAIDLILMDCEMPTMNGFETTEIIRKWQHGQLEKPCGIVALTAHTLGEHIEQCFDAGMDDHLSKPLQLNKLRELIETLEGNKH
jgi:signal transduction histidine kinase/CheY-like chemotaxis protein